VKSKLITTFNIQDRTYSIRATSHAIKRMQQRGIDLEVAIGSLFCLGVKQLKEYQSKDQDIAIINEDHNVTVIISFDNNRIILVTVINKSNAWVESGTSTRRI